MNFLAESESKLRTFLRNYYLSSSLYDFIFAYAIYNVLFKFRGMSVPQISILLAWWSFTTIILEIPSGALADYWSRKKMLVIAPVVKSLCFLSWFFAGDSFYLFALGFFFWSLGSSFVSGTSEALLYDTLNSFGRKSAYEKVLSKKEFFFHITLAVSTITGGFIANYSMNLTLLLSSVFLLLSFFFALKLNDAPKTENIGDLRYFDHIRSALKEVKGNKVIVYLLVYNVCVSIFADLEEFDQLYYHLTGLPLYAYGLAGFIWSLLNALGSYLAYRLVEKKYLFYFLPFLSGILLLFVGWKPIIPFIPLLILSYFLISPLTVLIDAKIQHQIAGTSRATVTSLNSLLLNVMGIFLTLFFGLLSKLWNLQMIYFFSSTFLLVFSGWVVIRKREFL